MSEPVRRFSTVRWRIAAVVAAVTLAAPAIAAARIFVSVPGAPGEANVPGFTGQIEALSLSFGYRAPIDPETKQQGSLLPAPITVTKPVDASTPKLMELGATFKTAGRIVIAHTRETVGGAPVFMTVTIDGAVVTDWLLVTDASGLTTEQVSFQPNTVTVEYQQFQANGQPGPKSSAKFKAQ